MAKPVLASICWYGLNHINTGGKVRTFNILKYMREFTPWIITPGIISASPLNVVLIKGRSWRRRCVFNWEILNYLWADKIWQIRNALKKINPDIVQAEGIWAFPAMYLFCRGFHKKSILVIHNIEWRVAEQLHGQGWRSSVLKIIEGFCYRRSDLLAVCSGEDRRKIVKDFSIPEEKIMVIPNGVEDKRINECCGYKKIKAKGQYLLFMGKLDYGPNKEAVSFITRKVMPRLRDIKCMIIGDGLGGRYNKNVEYLGRVDDVGRYLAKADICLSPIWSGSGTRLKVLEYLAAGRPMVATSRAVEGLGLEKGRHYLEAEDTNQFENAIKEILNNPEKWNNNAKEARTFILSRYNWQKIVSDYEKELKKCIEIID